MSDSLMSKLKSFAETRQIEVPGYDWKNKEPTTWKTDAEQALGRPKPEVNEFVVKHGGPMLDWDTATSLGGVHLNRHRDLASVYPDDAKAEAVKQEWLKKNTT